MMLFGLYILCIYKFRSIRCLNLFKYYFMSNQIFAFESWNKMKTITLSAREFFEFKKLAKFYFDFWIFSGNIMVTASIEELEALGY